MECKSGLIRSHLAYWLQTEQMIFKRLVLKSFSYEEDLNFKAFVKNVSGTVFLIALKTVGIHKFPLLRKHCTYNIFGEFFQFCFASLSCRESASRVVLFDFGQPKLAMRNILENES